MPPGSELPAVPTWLEVLTLYFLLHNQLWAVPAIRDLLLINMLIYSLKLGRPIRSLPLPCFLIASLERKEKLSPPRQADRCPFPWTPKAHAW